MKNKKVKLTDEFLMQTAQRINEILLERVDNYTEVPRGSYVPSARIEATVAEILGKQEKKKRVRAVKVVLVAAAIIAMLLAFAMGAYAVRGIINKIHINYSSDNVDVRYNVSGSDYDYENRTDVIKERREPYYIPANFTEYFCSPTDGDIVNVVNYLYKDEFIIYKQYPLGYEISVNTENINAEEIVINGFVGFYSESDGEVIIAWHDWEYAYELTCSLDIETAVKIAESVR